MAKEAHVFGGQLSANQLGFEGHRTGLFRNAIDHTLRDIRRHDIDPLFREPQRVNPSAAPNFDDSPSGMKGLQKTLPKNLPHPDRDLICRDVLVVGRRKVIKPPFKVPVVGLTRIGGGPSLHHRLFPIDLLIAGQRQFQACTMTSPACMEVFRKRLCPTRIRSWWKDYKGGIISLSPFSRGQNSPWAVQLDALAGSAKGASRDRLGIRTVWPMRPLARTMFSGSSLGSPSRQES